MARMMYETSEARRMQQEIKARGGYSYALFTEGVNKHHRLYGHMKSLQGILDARDYWTQNPNPISKYMPKVLDKRLQKVEPNERMRIIRDAISFYERKINH